MGYRLYRQQVVGGTLEEVFAFFKDPRNLEELTPPWLGFRILGATDGEVQAGTRIRYRLRVHGIPMGWESVIAVYEEGTRFADKMLRGPYRHWYHEHRFRPVPGGVEIIDEVDYDLPLGPLGHLVHAMFVGRELDRIFAWRRQAMARRFPAAHAALQPEVVTA